MVYLAPNPVKIYQDLCDSDAIKPAPASLTNSTNLSPTAEGVEPVNTPSGVRQVSGQRLRSIAEESTPSGHVTSGEAGEDGAAHLDTVSDAPPPERTTTPRSRRATRVIVRERRPSESFFEDSSSEEEEEDEEHVVVLCVSSPSEVKFPPISRNSSYNQQVPISPVEEPNVLPATTPESRDGVVETYLQHGAEYEPSRSAGDLGSELPDPLFHNGLKSHPVAKTSPSRPSETPSTVSDNPPKLRLTRPSSDFPGRNTFVKTPYPGTTENETCATVEVSKFRDACDKLFSSGSITRIDRFPSISPAETLYIELTIARHADVYARIEINVINIAAYDDEKLFRDIKSAYFAKILGWPRSAFHWVRHIVHVDIATPGMPVSDVCAADFMKHMSSPRIGRKHQKWLYWLRSRNLELNRQTRAIPGSSLRLFRDEPSGQILTCDEKHSAYEHSAPEPVHYVEFEIPALRTTAKPSMVREGENPKGMKLSHQAVDVNLYNNGVPKQEAPLAVLRLTFHYGFSFWPLAAFFSCVAWLSILSSVLWITLHGTPAESRSNGGYSPISSIAARTDTRRDDEGTMLRILTGLMLGFALFVIGVMVEGCLMLGGWIFL